VIGIDPAGNLEQRKPARDDDPEELLDLVENVLRLHMLEDDEGEH
jgi:hypothetical protein